MKHDRKPYGWFESNVNGGFIISDHGSRTLAQCDADGARGGVALSPLSASRLSRVDAACPLAVATQRDDLF
eukprot:7385143-Prymnesium_polylepis.5